MFDLDFNYREKEGQQNAPLTKFKNCLQASAYGFDTNEYSALQSILEIIIKYVLLYLSVMLEGASTALIQWRVRDSNCM